MTTQRQPLFIEDLEALEAALRAAGDPPPIFAAVGALSARVIGHRLFTVNAFDPERFEVARAYTSLPSVYPVAGRKKKAATAWGDHVLTGMQVFVARDPDGVRAAFDDHETILGLGLGSILNIPVCVAGRCVGTMNLGHDAGWFRPEDERTGRLLAAFLAPALLHL